MKIAAGLVIAAVVIAVAMILSVVPGPRDKGNRPAVPLAAKQSYVPLPPLDTTTKSSAASVAEAPPQAVAQGAESTADKEQVMASMHDAAITYDPASLPAIAQHLSSPDAEVRTAAAEAVVLLGDSAGAKFLHEAAKKARSTAEAADLKAKADYLDLPTANLLTKEQLEKLRLRKAQGQLARKQADKPPRRLQIPPSRSSPATQTDPDLKTP